MNNRPVNEQVTEVKKWKSKKQGFHSFFSQSSKVFNKSTSEWLNWLGCVMVSLLTSVCYIVGSNPGQIKPMIIKLVVVTSPLSMKY